jgi:MoxR-like ATPase
MMDLYPGVPSLKKPTEPRALPPHAGAELRSPEKYKAEPGLVDAVNVALTLRQPLMVTGEPGVGKTVLAWSVAWELGLDEPFVFESKSNSQARDLFYTFDTIGRFAAQQLGGVSAPARDYMQFNALGAAIVLANHRENVADVLPRGFEHPGIRRSVVLIDEVEKAPRDFANDILNEIERMYFRIPELGNVRLEADPAHLPVVILTNNSEKAMPDAFLRRCVYYHIPFPNRQRLEDIVLSRLSEHFAEGRSSPLLADAIEFMLQLRSDATELEKPPGTAELLNWLNAMARFGAQPGLALRPQREVAERTLTALIKTAPDQQRARSVLWRDGSGGVGQHAA